MTTTAKALLERHVACRLLRQQRAVLSRLRRNAAEEVAALSAMVADIDAMLRELGCIDKA